MENATTTLADSLLDDLDDLSDNEDEQSPQESEQDDEKDVSSSNHGEAAHTSGTTTSLTSAAAIAAGGGGGESKEIEDSGGRKRRINRLTDDVKLQSHLKQIRRLMEEGSSSDEKMPLPPKKKELGDVEQHSLITISNKHLTTIQTELFKAHRELVTAYDPKFPELEELIPDPMKYKEAVKVIQNETDMTLVNEPLNSIAKLTPNQIITLSVAGSTTSGSTLSPQQLNHVNDCIQYIDEIINIRNELITFVEQRMERMVPSTCVLIGPTLAARMIGVAGGLSELSRVPACNLQVLGQVKATSSSRAGMSTSIASAAAASSAASSLLSSSGGSGLIATIDNSTNKPHEGILAECELYRRVPSHLQRKALKVIAAKLALAIRCDFVNIEAGRKRSKDSGLSFRRVIEEKFLKWEEPEKAPVVKALPKPDLTTKKRRGGKRMRRLKEKFEETEMMKQANRRAFSAETGEYGDDAMGLTLGMLEKSKEGGGAGNLRHIRGAGVEKRKMRQANTKASRKRALQMSSGQTNGLASSMAFTPVQGMELVNPDAMKDKVRDANRKWFGENAGFESALPKER